MRILDCQDPGQSARGVFSIVPRITHAGIADAPQYPAVAHA